MRYDVCLFVFLKLFVEKCGPCYFFLRKQSGNMKSTQSLKPTNVRESVLIIFVPLFPPLVSLFLLEKQTHI